MEQPKKRGGRPKGARNKSTREFKTLYEKYSRLYKTDPVEGLFKIMANEMAIYQTAQEDGQRLNAARTYGYAAKEAMNYYYSKPQVEASEGEQGELVFTFSEDVKNTFMGKKENTH